MIVKQSFFKIVLDNVILKKMNIEHEQNLPESVLSLISFTNLVVLSHSELCFFL